MASRALLAFVAVLALAGCDSGGGQPRPTPTPTPLPNWPTAEPRPEGSDAVAPPVPDAASGAAAGGAAVDPAAQADYERKKVQYYFDQINYFLRTPKHGVPPEVPDADVLIAALRDKSDKVRALDAPAPVADHQRQVLAMLDASLALADRMRALRNTQDPSAKLAFAADRRTLEEQERQLDALAAEIKQQLAAPPPTRPQD